ncbi:uncharacterized protein LOC127949408 isoform X2 [Carassius gibelio]|uniref:uncharacterized protein LOC127949408 isoform X2 n=1 Tax=Carassius gibelio TaxID=101364 RepID=UPI002277D3D2|nr:uncharacterized protein LOC127949408 isoform X2 [Carassius gibelio]
MVITCIAKGCENKQRTYTNVMFHRIPSNVELRNKWLAALEICSSTPLNKIKQYRVCEEHFAPEDYFEKMEYGSRKTVLRLKDTAVPSIFKAQEEQSAHTTSQQGASSQELPTTSTLHEVRCQSDPIETETVATEIKPKMRSVGTQLSMGIQATYYGHDVGTQTTDMFPDVQLSSTPVRGSVFRPSKRPRLVLDEEEESELNVEPTDSTYNPDSVVTEESELAIDPQPDHSDNKYIVFESCLRELFVSCPICKTKCVVQSRRRGTFVAFTQLCEKCNYYRQWQSQPIVGSTPLGNLLLSAATYFTGGSFKQLEKIFKAMKLQMMHFVTFRIHARNFIEPTIIHQWNQDQLNLIRQLQEGGNVAVAGDMRADTPGHSAKFGSYTIMHMETNKILDLHLVQSNEVGGSYHMEKEGLKRCLDKLESHGLAVDYIVTDRHPQIQKYLRDRNITQFYNVWHFEKGLSKKLDKLSKMKDCEVLKKWLHSIKNHVYWSAISSESGPEKVAKWNSLQNHIQNVHLHENHLFPKCEHPDKVSRDPKKWFQPGSIALHKVEKLLYNKRVLKDIEKLSHNFQTSSLEAFHSLILRFAPKNVIFPFIGMLCRLYLAAMHYNENANREQATTTEGQAVYKFVFPKSKKGECTAKPVKIEPTYNYVDDLMSLLLHKVFVDPKPYAEELHAIPIPPPLSSQYEKPSKEEVIAQRVSRFRRGVAGTQHTVPLDQETVGGSG